MHLFAESGGRHFKTEIIQLRGMQAVRQSLNIRRKI
jgi:hypothetical protein